MWWLGLALFLVCIIERHGLDDEDNASWFNIFNILFELVSAYGTVGLSLGLPTANYSFSGALRPLSKLIICLVMIRGRHRGLPVAIDRAVMLPDIKSEDQRSFRRRLSTVENLSAYGGDGLSVNRTNTIAPSVTGKETRDDKEKDNSPDSFRVGGDVKSSVHEDQSFSAV